MADIFIFLDTDWDYNSIQDYVNFIVQRLNIKPYGSSITLLAAKDATIMVNRTFYVTDYYENWNRTSHSWFKPGFSLPLILSQAQFLAETIMKEERHNASLGGRSMIALLIPSATAFVYEYDYEYCKNYMNYLNRSLPGLTFLYYAGGAVIRFKDFVSNNQDDLFSLNYDLQVVTAAEPVIKRIRKVPRRLSNPRCSAYWSPLSTGFNQIMQYQGLGHINFYRLTAHYFFGEGSMRYLKIKRLNSLSFIVCTSRSNPWPYRNLLKPYAEGQECKQITGQDLSFDLGDLCLNYDHLMDCPPFYVSVEAQSFMPDNKCKEPACTTPNDSQFLIVVNNLDCTNRAAGKAYHQVIYLVLSWLVLNFFL